MKINEVEIWDFITGRTLSMAEGKYCSAKFRMSDSDEVLFGRTDKSGDATSIISWDLMGNQMIKDMRNDAPPSRQLIGIGGAHAHTRDVKRVALSEDSRYLVSGSADGTLKVLDKHTERPVQTMQGHTDEAPCDGTIRLWLAKNGTEMCVFNCGVDIFYVTMSLDKDTIVAIGDQFLARKLIMLQVVRTKIKKNVSS
ncbi:hypothetical protein DPMN_186682 [Dreissena polymorpha]|uniref:Uncharacterized protein n=1 Tax=Dreissena polymorpha TaxID=45954 RepID=A0A9D4DLX6_DREPO|nr:hypothetical protein DPMN_186682 [Dreissena polymorpha]